MIENPVITPKIEAKAKAAVIAKKSVAASRKNKARKAKRRMAKKAAPKPATRPPGPYKPKPETNGHREGKAAPASYAPAPVQRVNQGGLIHVANVKDVQALPFFHYSERSKWYGPNGQNGFSYYQEGQAKSLIAEHGFNKKVQDDQGNTPADRAMMWLMQNHGVAYAGPLAGHMAGCHESGGARILVTDSPRLIEPKPGKWPTIKMLIESLLADEEQPQIEVFYTWLGESFRAYWNHVTPGGPRQFKHCPALAIFGPKQCGKTALIDLILGPLFGGRRGDPMNFLRDGRFNKDLFAASLLVMDDKGASANLAERRQRGESIKDLIWKEEQRMEGKGVDALMLRPFWRLVIAGNDDDSGLQVCPALSPSLEDKMILLKARRAEGLPTTNEENVLWANAIRIQLPAFAAFLLGHRPPDTLKVDDRSRVVLLWHPELTDALREMQPEMRLLELIDSLDPIDGKPHWEGTASEFERDMRRKDSSGILDRLFATGQAAGRMLGELARVSPNRVTKSNWSGTSHYRIFPPKKDTASSSST